MQYLTLKNVKTWKRTPKTRENTYSHKNVNQKKINTIFNTKKYKKTVKTIIGLNKKSPKKNHRIL